MKKTKIILLATLGMCIISFLPTVAAKANVRPISDFTATNDYTGIAAWFDPDSNIIVFPHGFWVTPPIGLPPLVSELISDCEHHGSVLERDLKDGRILYQINLHVKGAFVWVGDYGVNPYAFVGVMDYFFSTGLIVEAEFGGPVPNLLDVWFGGAGEYTYSHITGTGSGTFAFDAFGFTAGETANFKINQVGLPKPEGHPFYPEMWPVEIVFFN
jgi:hypothetical protein